jgi:hypothetical protein
MIPGTKWVRRATVSAKQSVECFEFEIVTGLITIDFLNENEQIIHEENLLSSLQ